MKTLIIWALLFPTFALADVIKPTLVEVSIYEQKIEVELFTNIEALITGIGTQYKNTLNAPNAADYDKLRHLSPAALRTRFLNFEEQFLRSISFKVDGTSPDLHLQNIDIDEVGYTKRPRTSRLVYAADISGITTLSWQFAKVYGDNALRFRFVVPDEYTWRPWNYLKAGEEVTLNVLQYKPLNIWQTLAKFMELGFYHVIPLGLDHILFIVTMALGFIGLRKTIVLVSSFTLAHTLTLGLATYDVITISPTIIEPIIALSIVVMALDKLFFHINYKNVAVVVFGFGLLHGLGFALMLKEFITTNLFSSLIGFNLGVEFAQILIVIGVSIVLFFASKLKLEHLIIKLSALAIVVIGTMMIWERI